MNLAVEVLATRAAARGGQCAGAAAWPRCLHCNLGILPQVPAVESLVITLQLHYNARAPVHALSARSPVQALQCTRYNAHEL